MQHIRPFKIFPKRNLALTHGLVPKVSTSAARPLRALMRSFSSTGTANSDSSVTEADRNKELSEALSARDARWAKAFQIMPCVFGLILCSIPIVIAQASYKSQAAADLKKSAGMKSDMLDNDNMSFSCRGLELMHPQSLIDVFEGSIPCIVLSYRSDSFHSQLIITMLHEVAELCKKYELPIRVIGVNLNLGDSDCNTNSKESDTNGAIKNIQPHGKLSTSAHRQPDVQSLLESKIECPSLFCVRSDIVETDAKKSQEISGQSSTTAKTTDFHGNWTIRDMVLFILASTDLDATEAAENLFEETRSSKTSKPNTSDSPIGLEYRWEQFEKKMIKHYFCGDLTEFTDRDPAQSKNQSTRDIDGWEKIFSKS